MNRTTILLILFALVLCFGCKKASLETYSGENYAYIESFQINGDDNSEDTVTVNFANMLEDTTTIYLSVNTIGKLSNQIRNFQLGITSFNSKEGDYSVDTSLFFIPADTNKVLIPIHLNSQASLFDTSFILHFDIYPNAFFRTDFQFDATNFLVGHATHRVLVVSNIAIPPLLWTLYENYLGSFSRKKFRLMLENINGLVADGFDSEDYGYSESSIENISEMFQEYLNEMEASGNTIYEDDGSKMVMGPDVQ